MVMMTVNVAELKARLSKYLDLVQQGETITITSHRRPVARLSPSCSPEELEIQPPTRPVREITKLEGIAADPNVDGVGELLWDRRRR
jgi:prevent-host-death family protein